MNSSSISNVLSLKSTPIVASVLSGNRPLQKRKLRHVLPTPASPIRITYKFDFVNLLFLCDSYLLNFNNHYLMWLSYLHSKYVHNNFDSCNCTQTLNVRFTRVRVVCFTIVCGELLKLLLLLLDVAAVFWCAAITAEAAADTVFASGCILWN
jgi:hypothetical protein